MASGTQFLEFWALSFVTLSLAVVFLNIFFRFVDSDLQLHGFRKEAVIAAVASAVQGAGYWLSASLFHGEPFRRLVIPGVIVGFIYWIAHLEDWSGYEIGGVAFFQMVLLSVGGCLLGGELKMAVIFLGVFIIALVVIAIISKGL
jgi:hypothetical protein